MNKLLMFLCEVTLGIVMAATASRKLNKKAVDNSCIL